MFKHLQFMFNCPKKIGQCEDHLWGGMCTGFDNNYIWKWILRCVLSNYWNKFKKLCIVLHQLKSYEANKIWFICLKSLGVLRLDLILEMEGGHGNSFLLPHSMSLPSMFAKFLICSSLWVGKMVIVALGFQGI